MKVCDKCGRNSDEVPEGRLPELWKENFWFFVPVLRVGEDRRYTSRAILCPSCHIDFAMMAGGWLAEKEDDE